MDILFAMGTLGAIIRLLDEFAGVVVLIGIIAYVMGFLGLRDRIARLERRLDAEVAKNSKAQALVSANDTAHTRATPPPAAARTPSPSSKPVAPSAPPARSAPDLGGEPVPVARPAPVRNAGVTPESPNDGPLDWLRNWVSGGNWLVRSGILLLFVGASFLLKFAADHALLPVSLRLAGVALTALAMVAFGFKLKAHRRAYALALEGGGIGLMYLTLYAAFRLYDLLPAAVALSLMVLVAIAACVLALRQNALALAVLAAVGGFAAPLLASSGSGDHVLLFAYYTVLNVGVLSVALFRAWRALNLVGFVATFGVGALWGYHAYQPQHLASVEPFLVGFFALYVAVAVLFALKRSVSLRDPIDSTLLFGTPLAAFALQSQLVADIEFALCFSAVVVAGVYASLALVLHRMRRSHLQSVVEAFIALAIGFATVAIALAFDARWTSASWALEGAALVWVGCRQNRTLAKLAGGALQLLACGAWIMHGFEQVHFHHADYLGTVMLALAGLVSAASLNRRLQQGQTFWGDHPLGLALFLWGIAWWFAGGLLEIDQAIGAAHQIGVSLLYLSASAWVLDLVGERIRVSWFRHAASALPASLLLVAVVQLLSAQQPFASVADIGWPVAWLTSVLLARRGEGRRMLSSASMLAMTFWTVTGILGWQLFELLNTAFVPPIWRDCAWLAVPAIALGANVWACKQRAVWPFTLHHRTLRGIACVPLVLTIAIAMLGLNVMHPGSQWPLLDWPVLNPVDLCMVVGLLAVVMWWRELPSRCLGLGRGAWAVLPSALGFVWLNAMLLRTLHFQFDIDYTWEVLFRSTLVQTSVSLLWALSALTAMVFGTRRHARVVWLTGAALMGVVVLKLLLVDLASTGTLARIVSFIGVGALLLVVGWFSPVPPRRDASSDDAACDAAPSGH